MGTKAKILKAGGFGQLRDVIFPVVVDCEIDNDVCCKGIYVAASQFGLQGNKFWFFGSEYELISTEKEQD